MQHFNSKIAERMFAWRGEKDGMPPTKLGLNKALVDQWGAKLRYTPDAWDLSTRVCQPLFVYDRLMEGRDDFYLVADNSIPVGSAYTTNRFESWRKNLGVLSYPIAMEHNEDKRSDPVWEAISLGSPRLAPPALVKGYLYTVFSDSFYELDKHYRNGVQFQRKKVTIQIPFRYQHATTLKGNGGNDFIARIKAWMYVGIPEYWEEQFDGGMFFSPVKLYQPKNQLLSKYSFFGQPTGPIPKEEQPLKLLRPVGKTVRENGKEWVAIELEECSPNDLLHPYYGITPKRE